MQSIPKINNFYLNIVPSKSVRKHKGSSSDLDSIDESDTESQTSGSRHAHKNMVAPPLRRPSILLVAGRHHYGSFYLRMGAVGKLLKRWQVTGERHFYCFYFFSFWNWQHDLFWFRIWAIFWTGEGHKMS